MTQATPPTSDIQEDRRNAIMFAGKLLKTDPVVFDTETTGMGSEAEIIEIAVLSSDGQVLLDTLVCPTRPISPEATRVHGIDDAMVAAARPWSQVLPEVREIFRGRHVCSYNLEFDTRLIGQSTKMARLDLKEHGIRPLVSGASCLMELYAQYYGDWKPYHYSYTRKPLGHAIAQWELTIPGVAHRALFDSRAAYAVLRYMAATAV